MTNFDPRIIKHQIDQLLAAHPELLEDDVLRADMVEGSTGLYRFLRLIEIQRQGAVALQAGIKGTIATLTERKNRFERREDAIRELIFKLLEAAKQKKVELPEATLSIRTGVAKVIITDEKKLPAAYVRTVTEPDKVKIKEALNNKKFVSGATLSNAESVLSITVK